MASLAISGRAEASAPRSGLPPRVASGDIDAAAQLEARLVEARATREGMVAVNQALRRGASAVDFGGAACTTPFSEAEIRRAAASVYRLEHRLRELEQRAARGAVREQEGVYTYTEDLQANRVAFEFATKPPADVRDVLTEHGFKASRCGRWLYSRRMNAPALAAAGAVRASAALRSLQGAQQ